MQPEFNRGHNNLETGGHPPGNHFESPEFNYNPEINKPGQFEQHENRPSNTEAAPPEPIVVVPQTPAPVDNPSQGNSTDQSASVSLTANDDDIIEVEWVKIAKQVITQTQDDPRARERALSELQKDYLMKRYGKVIGE